MSEESLEKLETNTNQPHSIFNKDFFKRLGHVKNEKGRYQRQIKNILIEFEIFEDSDMLGTAIDIRLNGLLVLSGYYHNEVDFVSTIQLIRV